MADRPFTNWPKRLVGDNVRDTTNRPAKLRLKFPKFTNPESTVRNQTSRQR